MRRKWPWQKKKTGLSGFKSDHWPANYDYPGPQRTFPRRKSARRLVLRVSAALVILLVVLAARETELPAGRQVRETVRYLLTAEWNFEPLLQGAVRVASQIINPDDSMIGEWPAATRVSGGNVSSEKLWLPVSGKIVRPFGWSEDPADGLKRFHPGIDVQAQVGTPVRAALDGQVARLGESSSLGKYVLLHHGEECYTLYAGLGKIEVETGQWVLAGQQIAAVGEHGDVTGGGLHFELRENGEPVDPLDRLEIEN